MNKYFIKEASYVCEPPVFNIKMIYDNINGTATVNFYNGNVVSFFVTQQMNMTSNKDDFDALLQFVLISLLCMYSRDHFQDEILDGDIQGLYVYDNLERVKNKIGTTIWDKNW